jgi:hypothetical protein
MGGMVHDANVGTIGTHEKVAATFLEFLRHKGGARDSPHVRKLSTVQNLWQQTKAGLRANMAAATPKPEWLLAPPSKFPFMKKLMAQWQRQDLETMPIKSFLLEEHVEQFCLHCIWYHMQVTVYVCKLAMVAETATMLMRMLAMMQMEVAAAIV